MAFLIKEKNCFLEFCPVVSQARLWDGHWTQGRKKWKEIAFGVPSIDYQVNQPIVLLDKEFSLKMTLSTRQAQFETGMKPVYPSGAETWTVIFFPLIQENSRENWLHGQLTVSFGMLSWKFRQYSIHTSYFFNSVVWVGWRHMKSSRIHINIQNVHGETLSFPFYCLVLIYELTCSMIL